MKKPHDRMTHKTRYDNFKPSRRRYVIAFREPEFFDVPDFVINKLQSLEDISYLCDWSRPADVLRNFADEILDSNFPIDFVRRLTMLLCEDDFSRPDTYTVIAEYPVMSFYHN